MTTIDDSRTGVLADLCASLTVQVGAIDRLADEMAKRDKPSLPQPVFYTVCDQAVVASNFGVARLQGPDQGHFWYVRGLAAWFPANGVEGTAAGKADFFVSAADLRSIKSLTSTLGPEWRHTFQTLPAITQFSRGAIVLRFNEELFCTFSSATTGTPYQALVWVEDFEEGAVGQRWAE